MFRVRANDESALMLVVHAKMIANDESALMLMVRANDESP